MTLRDVLIVLLILVILAHFGGVSLAYGGPVGLLILVPLILVLLGKI